MFMLKDSMINWLKYQFKGYSVYLGRSIMAGMCIALGGAAYLKLQGVIGAVLFTFGLITILHYKLNLYTGLAGFVKTKQDWIELPIALIGNTIGCFFIAALLPIEFDGADIVFSRIEVGKMQCFCGAILCGLIMTLIVQAARNVTEINPRGYILPTLFGIPLFILCGFYHSIADAFYMFAVRGDFDLLVDYAIPYWLIIVLGNFVGCNIPRLFKFNLFYDLL